MINNVFLFIPEIIKRDYGAIAAKSVIVGSCWVLVLLAIIVDLHFGIKKARAIGEWVTSEGYRRTVRKFKDYYIVMFFALLFDLLLFVTYYLPFPMPYIPIVTLIAAMGLMFTEFKSVREKGDEKLRRRQNESFKELANIAEKVTDKEAFWKAVEFFKSSPSHETSTTDDNAADNIQ